METTPSSAIARIRQSKIKAAKSQGKSNTKKGHGFQFVSGRHVKLTDATLFRKELVEQSEAVAMFDAKCVRGLELDGTIEGTDLKLTEQAFGQLCNFSSVPVTFIKNLAKVNPETAMDAVQSMVRAYFHAGAKRNLVVDERDQYVLGLVGAKTYKPLSNLEAYESVHTALGKMDMKLATLDNGEMRVTFTDKNRAVNVNPKAKKNDIVEFGVAAGNSINGQTSAFIEEFNLRLVCTNGMTRRERNSRYQFQHRNDDLPDYYASAAIMLADNYEMTSVLMRATAVTTLETEDDVRVVKTYLADGRNGGGKELSEQVYGIAQAEAKQEGGNPDRPTIWNVVNGVTQVGRDAPTNGRREALEALGYRTLMRFGMPLLEN